MSISLLFKKKRIFEVVFISALLFAGIITFFILSKSHGVNQQRIFFTDPANYFMDFYNHIKFSAMRDPYKNTNFPSSEKAYPPINYLILYPFSKLFDYNTQVPGAARSTQFGIMSVVIFLVFSSILLAYLINDAKNGPKIIRFLTVLAFFTSGIFLFSLERANVIFLAVVCAAFFIMFYKSNNKILREISLIALAVAFSLKIYPAIFGLLLLYEKQYKDILRLIIYAVLIFFLPFLFLHNGLLNIGLLIRNAKLQTDAYLFDGAFYRFGLIPVGIYFGLPKPQLYAALYLGFALFVLAIAQSFSMKKTWKRVLLLSCAMVLTPPWSAFYCGLYLFIPIVLFLNEEEHALSDWIYLILILLVLNPFQINNGNIPISSLISNISLIVLYLFLCIESLTSTIKFSISYFGNIRLKKTFSSEKVLDQIV
jgi:hypothetical protein